MFHNVFKVKTKCEGICIGRREACRYRRQTVRGKANPHKVLSEMVMETIVLSTAKSIKEYKGARFYRIKENCLTPNEKQRHENYRKHEGR